MNISEIKAKLNVSSIDFVRGKIKDDKGVESPTEWLRSWDNANRIAIIAHQDVIKAAIGGATNLIIKTEQKAPTEGQYAGIMYTQHTICQATSIEVTL